ncbi:uncharacterized protein LOC126803632 [Argentina anserina]|uniref:uncharacterized protein LOC126803632 n=1 Tax=Argentina anserina TaxID=57926 RepID=UPI0021766E1C|nr:uncharacterized protein LOC126803632 [Potentilla anserina]
MAPNRIKSQLSGSQKKKRRQQRAALDRREAGSFKRFLERKTKQVHTDTNVNIYDNENEQENNEIEHENNQNENVDGSGNMDKPNLLENEEEIVIAEDDQQDACDDINMQEEERNYTEHVQQDARGNSDMEDAGENIDMQEEDDQHGSSATFDFSFDIDDLGNWEKMEQNSRDFIVERGPKRESNFTYPDDHKGRRFSSNHYYRVLPNGEKKNKRKDHNKTLLGQLGNEGLNDWKNVSARLASHERNKHHLSCFSSWIELEIRLKKNATIDQGLEEQIKKKREHWRQVLLRILAVVKSLVKNNLSFRGNNEKLCEENNGVFLQVIEMISKFDPVMHEHVRRVLKKETHYHYLSHKIQNEMIQLLTNEVKASIVATIKEAKYFSVILDCTPDASHEEQMSLIGRCVDVTASPIVVREFFLGFLKVNDTTGLGLFNELTNALDSHTLNIGDIRGQGYDNRSNMRGKHKGVQSRLLECLEKDGDDSKTRSTAQCMATYEMDFEFLLGMVIWYDLLHAINIVSKFLQTEDMHIDVAIEELEKLMSFIQKYRETRFDEALVIAKEIASEMEIEVAFREKRNTRKKRHFDESDSEDEVTPSSLESFKLEKLKYVDNNSLRDNCMNLEKLLKDGDASDVNGSDLFDELNYLRRAIPKEAKRAVDVLNYLKQRDECYPNAWERLNGLALLSIEKDLAHKLDYSSLVETFAAKNARRVIFQ